MKQRWAISFLFSSSERPIFLIFSKQMNKYLYNLMLEIYLFIVHLCVAISFAWIKTKVQMLRFTKEETEKTKQFLYLLWTNIWTCIYSCKYHIKLRQINQLQLLLLSYNLNEFQLHYEMRCDSFQSDPNRWIESSLISTFIATPITYCTLWYFFFIMLRFAIVCLLFLQ